MNITIIGLGVVGGSLGYAVKEFYPGAVITGLDRKKVISDALRKGVIDFGAGNVASAVHDADIIFLCTPVNQILDMIPDVAAFCRHTAIVTDVGSTKGEIVRKAKKHFRSKAIFVGGHPMAGSEGKGIEHADALLFQNATYVLCADRKNHKRIKPLTDLLTAVGARILFLSAPDHDKIASAISHLPQLIAVGMMSMIGKKNKSHHGYLQLAAGGFRDITRIASSPYGMWNDILATNASEIQNAVSHFTQVLSRFKKQLNSSTGRKKISDAFSRAKSLRDAIPKNTKGFLHPLFEVYVAVEDKPGVLSAITTLLFREGINIKDIELLKIRDGKGGTFRLSFTTKKEAERAGSLLRKKNIITL